MIDKTRLVLVKYMKMTPISQEPQLLLVRPAARLRRLPGAKPLGHDDKN